MRTLVEDVMSTDVAAVEATTAVETVAQVLDARKISAVPVVDRDNLVLGVVSEVDVLRHRFTGRSASDVMSTPAVTIRPDQPAAVAAQRMDRHGIKRLPAGRIATCDARPGSTSQTSNPAPRTRRDGSAAS